jgi:hypothetical protein
MMTDPHNPGLASNGMALISTVSQEAAGIESAYRLLMIQGLSAVEAGNVVAYIIGLHPAERGWTVEEIKHLEAIRAMVAAGLIDW